MDPECPVCHYLLKAVEEFNVGRSPDEKIDIEYRLPPKRYINLFFDNLFGEKKHKSAVIKFDDYTIHRTHKGAWPHWKTVLSMLEKLHERGGSIGI